MGDFCAEKFAKILKIEAYSPIEHDSEGVPRRENGQIDKNRGATLLLKLIIK